MFWKVVKGQYQTIAFQIATALGLTSALLLVTLCTLLYWLVSWQINHENNRFMDDVTSLVQTTLRSQDNILPILRQQIPQELAAFHFNPYQVRIVSPDKPDVPLFQSPHFPIQALPVLKQLPVYPLNQPPGDGKLIDLPNGMSFLVLAAQGQIGQHHPQPALFQLALDVSPKIRILEQLRINLLIFVLIGTTLFSLVGTWLVKRGLLPLHEFRNRIQDIHMESLDQRISTSRWPQELRPLAQSFDRLLARLQKDVDQITRFSGDLAHELRTPITGLRVETEVLLTQARSEPEYRTALEDNLVELERLSDLIERILLLARVDNPQFMAKWQTFSARSLVEKLIEFYTFLADEKQIILAVEGDLQLTADPQLIEQAIGNLLSNAIKYTEPGGQVRIILAQETDPDDNTISLIQIKDNGIGIPQEDTQRIFERFYRGDPSRSKTITGDGLGLAIVKSIMELHGGDVRVQSQPGQGSMFSLVFG